MKKLILTLAIIFISTSFVFPQSLKSISNIKKQIIPNSSGNLYQNISLGFDIYSLELKKNANFGFNSGIRHQFSRYFYLEAKFDLIFGDANYGSRYIFALIPQWSIMGNKTFNLLFGGGLEIHTISQEGYGFLPLVSVKLEYKLSADLSIVPELRIPTPYIASLNFSYRFPL